MNETLAGDVIIYTLMGSTVINGIICMVYLIPALKEVHKKYCQRRPNWVTSEPV